MENNESVRAESVQPLIGLLKKLERAEDERDRVFDNLLKAYKELLARLDHDDLVKIREETSARFEGERVLDDLTELYEELLTRKHNNLKAHLEMKTYLEGKHVPDPYEVAKTVSQARREGGNRNRIMKYFNRLTEMGQAEAAEQVGLLTEIPRFRKPEPETQPAPLAVRLPLKKEDK